MGRARVLQEVRVMRFEDLLARHERGELTQEEVGELLGMSGRTLRRRLADEGTTVTAILDETRTELARQLIVDTRMPIHEIAQTLHYTKPGAFSRAYLGWTGITPLSARRAALRAATIERPERPHRPRRR